MIKMSVNVINAGGAKRSISGLFKRLKEQAQIGRRAQVLVGVQKGAGNYDDGTPIAVIAAANHFGTSTIPARRFLDVAVANNSKRYANIVRDQIPKVLRGKMDMDAVLNAIGNAAVGDVQDYMVDLRTPPNAPSTIKKKGSDNPLVDTITLRPNIRHEIAREPVEEGL